MTLFRFTQVCFFLLAFTVEVDLKAADNFVSLPLQKDPIVYPPNCVTDSDSCGYKTYPTRRYLLKLSEGELTLGSDTIVLRKGTARYALVSGTMMFLGNENFTIETPMGTLKTTSDQTNVIVEKFEKNYLVKVISGRVEVQPKGAKEPILVLAAYENKLSGVDEKGVAVTAFPKPIDIASFLPMWAALYNGDKNQFKTALNDFKSVHNQAVEDISKVYAETSKREIASYQQDKKLREERRRKDIEEKAFLRRMFERRLKGLE